MQERKREELAKTQQQKDKDQQQKDQAMNVKVDKLQKKWTHWRLELLVFCPCCSG
jgi:hypothetical protein